MKLDIQVSLIDLYHIMSTSVRTKVCVITTKKLETITGKRRIMSGGPSAGHDTTWSRIPIERESHVYSFTFAKRPQLGTKPKSNTNSLNPGGDSKPLARAG